ncbi:MAG TPA: VTT domain-containing protein [Anaeromyxobacteraceae bacterium]|nr:VTT domain-containing protein [Anaeromyxobacteraceae bacterium]
MQDLLARFSDLAPWQIGAAATWLLLQGCVLPSVPEEIVIATLGMLASQGRIGFVGAFGAVLLGLLPANSAAVFFGSRLARGISRAGPLRHAFESGAVQEALASVRRHGRGLVFATRFTPLVRGPVYLACGASEMGVPRFFAVDSLAACVQVPLVLWLGARLGGGAASLAAAWQRIGFLAAGLVGAALAVQVLRRLGRVAV